MVSSFGRFIIEYSYFVNYISFVLFTGLFTASENLLMMKINVFIIILDQIALHIALIINS